MDKRSLLILMALLLCCSGRDTSRDGEAVSFVAFGDWGTGSVSQLIVALEVEDYCQDHECEFVLALGDNFYGPDEGGTDGDPWETKYARMYGKLNLPFYAALGNHDMEGNYRDQLERSRLDPLWIMPGEYYSTAFPSEADPPVLEVFVVNSSNLTDQAVDWLAGAIGASTASWKLLVLHEPLIGNGLHGGFAAGAGSSLLPIICGKIDLVVSGHEHFFSHLRQKRDGCRLEQLIIGTGGATLSEPDATDPRVVSTGAFHGFGWFQVSPTRMTFRMIREKEKKLSSFYEASWRKP